MPKEKEEEKVFITKDQFRQFVTLYHDRYGDWSMGADTMRMWYDKLNHLDWEEFKECYQELLGAQQKPFGWKALFVVHKAMYPPTDPTLAMRDKCRDQGDKAKQGELSKIMAGYTTGLKAARKRGEKAQFDWVKEYAQKTIDIFGEKEAGIICAGIKNSDYSSRESFDFCEAVNRLIGRK